MSTWTKGERKNSLTYEQNSAFWKLANAIANLTEKADS